MSNDWFLNANDSRDASVVWKEILKSWQHGPARRWLSFDSFKWMLVNGRLSSVKGGTMFEVVKGKSLINIEWKDMFSRPLLDREYAVVEESIASPEAVLAVRLAQDGIDKRDWPIAWCRFLLVV
ncbi:hypothetical protein V6N13_097040 [Hibiscus sabdariffa]